MKGVFRVLASHLRVGYVGGLVLLDLVLWVLILWDCFALARREASRRTLEAAASFDYAALSRSDLSRLVLILFVLVLLLPILLGAARITFFSRTHFSRRSWPIRGRGRVVYGIHWLLALGYVSGLAVLLQAERLSGVRIVGQEPEFSYRSASTLLLDVSSRVVVGAVGLQLFAIVCTEVYQIVKEKQRRAPSSDRPATTWWGSYKSKTLLADLKSDLYPGYRRSGNFNAASMAPELRGVRRRARELFASYQAQTPGSLASGERLNELYSRCQEKIVALLDEGTRMKQYRLEILPGTARALDVAVGRARGRRKRILLSPFEHPVEHAVARWLEISAGCKVHEFTNLEDLVDKPWVATMEAFCGSVAAAIEEYSEAGESPILVMSEVAWASGLIVPVREVVEDLDRRIGRGKFQVIVDGAHVPGNLAVGRGLDCADYYLASAHKWMMAPDPCGLLLSRQGGDFFPVYDGWSGQLPESTASVRLVSGLLATLEQLGPRMGYVRQRSSELVREFRRRLPSRIQVVGEESGLANSFMMAVEPEEKLAWRFSSAKEIGRFCEARGVSLNAIEAPHNRIWLRVAFPYFHDAGNVRRLVRCLEASLEG